MDRREFLRKAGLVATWAAIPIVVTGCGDDDGGPTGTDNGDGNVPGSVSNSGGHSHSVAITRAQIDAGDSVTLTLTGSGHTHTVSLTANEVMNIGDGERVSKESSNDRSHSHTVTFN